MKSKRLYVDPGRLSVTFYKNDAALPGFKDYSMDGGTYRYYNDETLYPFGYGLSYATFKYSALQMSATIKNGEALTVYAQVTNTGNSDGDEVAQLYLSYQGIKSKVPLRTL